MFNRFQLGDWLPLSMQVRDANGVPGVADEPGPTVKIFEADGSLVETINLPVRPERIADLTERLGGHEARVRLGSDYSVGKYMLTYAYETDSGANVRGHAETFEIVAGGNASGAVIASHFHDLPNANNVVFQLDNGDLRRRINPR
jgi:hypothetical protein